MTNQPAQRPPPDRSRFIRICLQPLLRGSGQMLFQPSALTGGVFLLLVASQSGASLLTCLAGLAGSTLCAYMLEHPGRAYFQGEGGFNGGLLGLALSVFYEPGPVLVSMALTGGVLTEVVRVGLLRLLPVPPFTAPFVLVAWSAFGLAALAGLVPVEPPVIEPWPFYAAVTNASQVLFLLQPWVGILVLVAVWLHSRAAALWVGSASVVAWLAAMALGAPPDLTAAGLLGYNGLILAAALQHRATRWWLFITGVVASVCLSYLFLSRNVTPLSAPFVLSAWLVIAVESRLTRRSAGR